MAFLLQVNFNEAVFFAYMKTLVHTEDGQHPIKVLVAEDAPMNQFLLKAILDSWDFQYDIADNGKIAIEKLQNNNYDIILLDLQMPEVDGFEVAGFIRDKMNSSIPIIALTANAEAAEMEKCSLIGIADCMAKPVNEALLYNRIKELISPAKYINLGCLRYLTKNVPALMEEMITLCLEQVPALTDTMRRSLDNADWVSLHSVVHRLIPSFSMMGMPKEIREIAEKLQKSAAAGERSDEMGEWVEIINSVCMKACAELKEYLKDNG